mmetsp:Transcript_12848/g.19810  ORF Transcript_12848/g.19810 Transcript_12848/m.19810 type:complete len:198 (-) Transcript_12848:112-705(-)
MKSQFFSTAALILLSTVSGALATEESNLRGAAASISEDSFDLEDFELDSFDGEDAFLADPCSRRSDRNCRNNRRCEIVRRPNSNMCRQKLNICTGLSMSECGARDRNCRYKNRRCERKHSCGGMRRNECNNSSPDCRWDHGECVRKHEGKSNGPDWECRDMNPNQCRRSKHCMVNSRNVCAPNLVAEFLENSEMMED